MAKYLEICPFVSTKALKCFVMVLEKTIKVYHWASQGRLVGLRAWPVFGVAAWPRTVFIGGGSAVWTLAPHFRVSPLSVGIWGIGVSGSKVVQIVKCTCNVFIDKFRNISSNSSI